MKLMSGNWARRTTQFFFTGDEALVVGLGLKPPRLSRRVQDVLSLRALHGIERLADKTAEGASVPTLCPELVLVPSGLKMA